MSATYRAWTRSPYSSTPGAVGSGHIGDFDDVETAREQVSQFGGGWIEQLSWNDDLNNPVYTEAGPLIEVETN